MKTLKQIRDKTARRLLDPGMDVWSASEIDGHTRDGYVMLSRLTSLFWEMDYIVPTAGTALYTLPTDRHVLERVVYDGERIDPWHLREAILNDPRYRTTQGDVVAYMQQGDGIDQIRLLRIPSGSGTAYTYTGTWGIPRGVAGVTSDSAVTGTFGIARRVQGHHPIREFFGAPRRFYPESLNLRVEFWRKGKPLLLDTDPTELPRHFDRYLIYHNLWKCFERDGEGYDTALAQYFQRRWLAIFEIVKMRRSRLRSKRLGVLGDRRMGTAHSRRHPPVLPDNYGTVIEE